MKRAIRVLPPVEYLQECFDYDPKSGALSWKKLRPMGHFADTNRLSIWKNRCAGKLAGNINPSNRCLEIGLNGIAYGGHRIIWKLMTGTDPFRSIDHIDGDRLNNRWINLRLATAAEQLWNIGIRRDNTSGRRGCVPHKNKWIARLQHDRIGYYLGIFDTIEEASAVYEAAASKLRGEFYRRVENEL